MLMSDYDLEMKCICECDDEYDIIEVYLTSPNGTRDELLFKRNEPVGVELSTLIEEYEKAHGVKINTSKLNN